MFSRFFKSTLFFMLAFSLCAHSTIANLSHKADAKGYVKQTEVTSVSSTPNPFVIDLAIGINNAAHLTSQNYKPSNLFKESAVVNSIAFGSLSCSKYISRSSQVALSRFIKLVLFPFHAFW